MTPISTVPIRRPPVPTNAQLRATVDELQRRNDQLRVADEQKSDYVATVSHEFKAPLTSILGYCSMMLRRWDEVTAEQQLSFIGIIEEQSQRLSRLVHDLLDVSHIESGHLETHLQAVGGRALVEELLSNYPGMVNGLTIDVDEDISALADPDQLQRVLINLVDNANKYGKPPITVAARREGDRVVLMVADEGPGVAEEFRPHLFQKFAQASAGVAHQSGSAGLGLSIVRGLAQAMGGEVSYEPVAPTGARFVLRLQAAN